MPTEPIRRDIHLSGLRLSALERDADGAAGKPPILLLHGLIAEAETFQGLIHKLPRDRRVVALDLPGAGYSDRGGPRSVSFSEMAEIVREAMKTLGLENAVLLGHSHGGAVGLQFAARYPTLLHSLVLLCPAHPFSGREDALVSFYLSRTGRAFGHLLPRLPDWLHLFAFRRMPGTRRNFTRRELAPYLHTLRTPGTVDHLLKLLSTWKHDMQTLREELQAQLLSVPTLLLWGDKDMIVPIASADRLTACLTSWEMFTLAGVGHLPNEEAPGECADLMKTWLTWRDTHWKYQQTASGSDQSEGVR